MEKLRIYIKRSSLPQSDAGVLWPKLKAVNVNQPECISVDLEDDCLRRCGLKFEPSKMRKKIFNYKSVMPR